ncbi:mCG1027459, isoform CRA_a, partial [Mus musculus]
SVSQALAHAVRTGAPGTAWKAGRASQPSLAGPGPQTSGQRCQNPQSRARDNGTPDSSAALPKSPGSWRRGGERASVQAWLCSRPPLRPRAQEGCEWRPGRSPVPRPSVALTQSPRFRGKGNSLPCHPSCVPASTAPKLTKPRTADILEMSVKDICSAYTAR